MMSLVREIVQAHRWTTITKECERSSLEFQRHHILVNFKACKSINVHSKFLMWIFNTICNKFRFTLNDFTLKSFTSWPKKILLLYWLWMTATWNIFSVCSLCEVGGREGGREGGGEPDLPIDSTVKSKFRCGNCFLLDFGLPWSVTILTISGKKKQGPEIYILKYPNKLGSNFIIHFSREWKKKTFLYIL